MVIKPSDEACLARQREKPKSFEHYEQTQPIQPAPFEILGPENKQYSNTSKIYKFLPKKFLERFGKLSSHIHLRPITNHLKFTTN